MAKLPDESTSIDRRARRNGRLYLIGLAASLIGNSAMALVAGIWVKSVTGSSSAAGLVSACIYAPSVAGPIGGLVADRVDRRRFLLVLNVASALLILPLLAVDGADRVWIIFAVMTWYGVALMLSGPAESALFVEMLPIELRQRMNGWNLGLQETGRLVAPLAGAGLFTLVGGSSVALLDSATFVVAAVMIWKIQLPEPMPTRMKTHRHADVLAGVGHIRRTPELRDLVGVAGVVIGISGLGVAAQYSLVEALGRSPSFLGVLSAGLGAGSIVASLLSSRVLRRLGEGWLAVIGAADFALGNLLRASGSLPAAVAGSVILGFALPWVFLAVLNLAQRRTPLALQGRVSAVVTLAVFGPQAPIQALGSAVIVYVSYRTIYVASAVLALACAAWLAYRVTRHARITEIGWRGSATISFQHLRRGWRARKKGRKHMSEGPQVVAVDHITITVRDMAKAKHFYEEVLGLRALTDVRVEGESTFGGFAVEGDKVVELATASEGSLYDAVHGVRHMVIFERVGGTSLTLIAHPGDELGGSPSQKLDRLGYTHLAFDVPDLDAFIARARSLGVEPPAPGFLQDPDGNLIQFQEVGQSDRIHKLYHDRYVNEAPSK